MEIYPTDTSDATLDDKYCILYQMVPPRENQTAYPIPHTQRILIGLSFM